ncbi:MAG TPA: hypothetical protein VJJ02_04670 [Candidatus Paceibacterota bacterium]
MVQTNNTPNVSSNLGADDPSPREVYEQMERYLRETEGLLMLLRESLTKGEEQIMALRAFDVRAPQLSSTITTIDPAPLQSEIEEVRKRVTSLEELRDRAKEDIEKVKEISEKITGFVNQYQAGK